MNAAIKAAELISGHLPENPRAHRFGACGTSDLALDDHYYCVILSASIAAWQCVAGKALMDSIKAAPRGWITYTDSFETIRNTRSLQTLKDMCDPTYPWPGCWADRRS